MAGVEFTAGRRGRSMARDAIWWCAANDRVFNSRLYKGVPRLAAVINTRRLHCPCPAQRDGGLLEGTF